MAIRVRFEHTRYRHLGDHSGYVQLVRYLDSQNYATALHGAADGDADLPRWLSPLRPGLRRFIQSGRLPWYKLSDLTAEFAALPDCLTGRFDIIHFLDGEHSARYLPRLIKLSRLPTIRTVATFHQPPDIARQVVDGGLLRWLDRIVLVSPSQLPFFRQHVPEERLHVLLHGVDADFFHPASAPNTQDRIRCITAGHWLRDWPTFEGVVRALKSTCSIAFEVVGGAKLDFDHHPAVTVHRGIDDLRLAELYRSADVLFLPLADSTANNSLLEGMASGLAVVTTDLDSTRAYLPAGEGILVGDGIAGFVAALQQLRGNVGLRHDLGRRARAPAEELAWPRLISDYERFYRDLATGVGAEAPA